MHRTLAKSAFAVAFLLSVAAGARGQDPMGDKPFDLVHRGQVMPPRVMKFPCQLIINCDVTHRTPSIRLIRNPGEIYQFDYQVQAFSDSLVAITIEVLNFENRPKHAAAAIALSNKSDFRLILTNNFSGDTAEFRVTLGDSLKVETKRKAAFVDLKELRRLPPEVTLFRIATVDQEKLEEVVRLLFSAGEKSVLEPGFYLGFQSEIRKTRVKRWLVNSTDEGALFALKLRDSSNIGLSELLSQLGPEVKVIAGGSLR